MSIIKAIVFETADSKLILLRSMKAEEADDLIGFSEAMFARHKEMNNPEERQLLWEQSRNWIRGHNESIGKIIIAAYYEGELIGVLNYDSEVHDMTTSFSALGINIRSNWTGKGIGAAMMDAFLKWAEEEHGVVKVSLSVYSVNERAIRFYRRFGFEETGKLSKGHAEKAYNGKVKTMCRYVK